MPAPPPRILPCSLSQFAHRGRISALSVTLTITPPHTACAPGQSSARRRQRRLRMLFYVIPSGRRCRVAPAAKPNGKTAPNQTGKKRGGAARDLMSARGRSVIETRPTALGRHVLLLLCEHIKRIITATLRPCILRDNAPCGVFTSRLQLHL